MVDYTVGLTQRLNFTFSNAVCIGSDSKRPKRDQLSGQLGVLEALN